MSTRLFLLVIFFASAAAGAPVSVVSAQSLDGDEGIAIPPPGCTVVVIPFHKDHNDTATKWFETLVPLEQEHRCRVIQLNVMEDPGFFLRNLIHGTMRMSYGERRQSRTYTVFMDPVAFRESWDIVDGKQVAVVVLDAARNRLALERGEMSADRLSRVRHSMRQ